MGSERDPWNAVWQELSARRCSNRKAIRRLLRGVGCMALQRRTVLFFALSVIAFALGALWSPPPAAAYYFNRNHYVDLGLSEPEDLFITSPAGSGAAHLWVLDREKNLILETDLSGRVLRTIEGNGPVRFSRPAGLWVAPDGSAYVTDAGNRLVLRVDRDGRQTGSFQPAAEAAAFFTPDQVAVDPRGYVYVLNGGQAILVFDPDGRQAGTLAQAGDRPGQLGLLTALTIDSEGFIYVAYSSGDSRNPRGRVARYDYQGRLNTTFDPFTRSRFTALAVDELGNLFAVNQEGGDLFKFDRRGKLMFRTGSLGPLPSSVRFAAGVAAAPNGNVYVLDTSHRVQILEPGSLSLLIDRANEAFRSGDYEGAHRAWEDVIQLNNYLDFAHVGLGDTFLKQHRWQAAIREFELGRDVWRHSLALREYRRQLLALYGWWIAALAIAAGFSALAAGPALYRRLSPLLAGRVRWLAAAVGMLTHPFRTLQTLRQRVSVRSAVGFILWVWLVNVLDAVVLNPLFPGAQGGDQFLFLKRLGVLFFLWGVWSAAAFGVGEVLGGEGRPADFLKSTAYSLAPYALFSLPVHVASNLLTLYEKVYFDRANTIILVWCAVLLFAQTRLLHRFGELRAAASFALSIAATVLAIGCAGLLSGVNNRVIAFVQEVAAEVYNYTL